MKKDEADMHADRLYRAVQKYVEAHGGKLVVAGGVSLQRFPGDNKGVFHLAVKCLGRPPGLPRFFPISQFRRRQ